MNLRWAIRAAMAIFLLASYPAVYAGTVHGTVKNGTTGQPAASVEVILIQLQGGMQPVLNSKTDAQGQFSFDYSALGTQPMLIRAVYRGVFFHTPVPPGTSEVSVTVYEPSQDPKTITVPSHVVIFQPNGSSLLVGEEYTIQNNSQPPKSYFRADGDFDFVLPEKAELKQISAQGPAGMPVIQAPIERGKQRYSIAFAFHPGENGVRYSYELPYPGNAATVKLATIYPGARLLVVAPPTVQVTGEGLQPGGQEQGMNLYGRDKVPVNTSVSVNLSETAPPPNTNGDAGSQGQDAQQGEAATEGVSIQVVPGRLDSLKWPIIFGFIGVFVLGGILLARRPVVAIAGGASGGPVSQGNLGETQPAKPQKASAATTPTPPSRQTPSLASVDAAVGVSLDSLKDTLFRLELRRQAGTITEEDYREERAKAEKVLRDLVRG